MKQCSKCHQTYPDDDLNFCQLDGIRLVSISDSSSEETLIRPSPFVQQTLPPGQQGVSPLFAYSLIGLLALIVGGAIVFVLRPNNEVSSVSPTVTGNPTPFSSLNQPPAQVNPTLAPQPVSDYETKNVRAGTADGKRLRVVVDLTRSSLNSGNAARFETLAAGGASGEARVFIHARNENSLSVKYESKQARKLGTVYLSAPGQGLEVKVVPQSRLYLRDVFFIPRSSANPNDRVVIDLCLNEDCPSLHP